MCCYQQLKFSGQNRLRVCVVVIWLLSSCASNEAEVNPIKSVQGTDEASLNAIAADSNVIAKDKLAGSLKPDASSVVQNSMGRLLEVNIFNVNQARPSHFVKTAVAAANALFAKCQISLKATIESIAIAPNTSVNRAAQDKLVAQYGFHKPALFLVSATAERDVAFSYLPSLNSSVAATSWLTDRVSDRCFVWIMVHELGHVMFDHARHSPGTNNIMSVACKQQNWGRRRIAPDWTDEQCIELRQSKAVSSIKVES